MDSRSWFRLSTSMTHFIHFFFLARVRFKHQSRSSPVKEFSSPPEQNRSGFENSISSLNVDAPFRPIFLSQVPQPVSASPST
ncbi:unnamed protein product [Linum tenue]|uniref:Uncharacterized protein n=1 Tax=Linum tenue TaxID=586396 RepID=A0AAV0HMT1_9ROSI|nr:unnamed protein product [Linum tenue]